MRLYRVSLRIEADSPEAAEQIITKALGFDTYSINDIGGVEVCGHEAGLVPNDTARTWECELGCGYKVKQ